MKTTFNIDESLVAELKREAGRQRRTMSEIVESALRLMLRSPPKSSALPELPTFHGGGELVDIADRDALYRAMKAARLAPVWRNVARMSEAISGSHSR